MGWVRIDDQFGDHPKVVEVDNHALALWVVGLCYCNQYLTDGKLPHKVVEVLARKRRAPLTAIAQLVRAGLWDEVNDGGYQVHDYLDFNAARTKVLHDRNEARTRMQQARNFKVSSGEVRPNISGSSRNPTPTPTPTPSTEVEIQVDPSLLLGGSGGFPASDDALKTKKPPSVTAVKREVDPIYSADFLAFWQYYPRKESKHAAWLQWQKRLKGGTTVETMIAASSHLAQYVEAGGQELKYVQHASRFIGPERTFLGYVDGMPTVTAMAVNGRAPVPKGYAAIAEAFGHTRVGM